MKNSIYKLVPNSIINIIAYQKKLSYAIIFLQKINQTLFQQNNVSKIIDNFCLKLNRL